MTLTAEQLDRALGVAVASAAGDALGAGYEFQRGWTGDPEPAMVGGGLGGFEPGEWTDDTTMAWGILDVAADGADLRDEAALTAIGRRWYEWAATGPKDIGIQTRHLFDRCSSQPTADELTDLARRAHESTGRTAGNGSLMRTWPVALAHLDDEEALVEATRLVCELTHFDPLNAEACTIWCCAIRHAVLTGELDVRVGLRHLTVDRRELWDQTITAAETHDPSHFAEGNGFVVTALQAAWSAITHTPEGPDHLAESLQAAVRIGNDTDTVAAIAGQLLGARWGASAVPDQWRTLLHGYPGITGDELAALARRTVRS